MKYSYYPQCVYVFARVVLYWLLQLCFVWGPAHVALNLPLVHTLLITSACLLAMSLGWFLLEMARLLLRSRTARFSVLSSFEHAGHNNNTPVDGENPVEAQQPPMGPDVLSISQTVHVTPMVLWYYVHAIGGSIFIIAYCVSGLSVLPTLCLVLCITISIAITFLQSRATTLFAFWALCQVFAVFFLLYDHIIITMAMSSETSTVLLGVVMPLCATFLVLKLFRASRPLPLSPHDIIAFTLPSLTLLAALFLSVYFAAFPIISKESSFSSSYYYYYAWPPLNSSRSANQTAADASSYYYDFVSSLLGHPATTAMMPYENYTLYLTNTTTTTLLHDTFSMDGFSVFMMLCCPAATYALLTLFFASFRSELSMMNNVTAFTLAYVLRRVVWFSISYMTILSLVLAVIACCALPAHTATNNIDDVVMDTTTLDEDDEQEVAYQRADTISSNNTVLQAQAV